MKTLLSALVLALALTTAAAAQQLTVPPGPAADAPLGAPFRTGQADGTSVPLRDFLSRDIDSLSTWVLRLFDERDRQYSQQFRTIAERAMFELQAAKDALVLARDERREATIKAEQATAQHFSSINGLNDRLESQAKALASIETVTALEKSLVARLDANRESITSIERRLIELSARGTGVGEVFTWFGWVVATGLGLTALVAFFRSQQQQSRPAPPPAAPPPIPRRREPNP